MLEEWHWAGRGVFQGESNRGMSCDVMLAFNNGSHVGGERTVMCTHTKATLQTKSLMFKQNA